MRCGGAFSEGGFDESSRLQLKSRQPFLQLLIPPQQSHGFQADLDQFWKQKSNFNQNEFRHWTLLIGLLIGCGVALFLR